MRIRLAFVLILTGACIRLALASGQYSIEFMKSEEALTSPCFSIVSVSPYEGGLRLFLDTDDPGAVSALLTAGALEAQLSDHQAETATTIPLLLGKAVTCTEDDDPVYLDYAAPLPSCNGKPPVLVEYFFSAPVTLGPSRDLAIGQDPDFLWLIEEQ